MFGRFKVYLEIFFERRVEDIAILAQKDDSVIAMLIEEKRLQDKILIEKLDEEGQKAFMNYESANSCLEAKIRDRLYRQGFFDGMKVVRIFSK